MEKRTHDIVAIVSHDLRNPLATIQLAVTLLLEVGPDAGCRESHRRQLHVIRRAAARMHELVHDLLDAASAEGDRLPISPTPTAVQLLIDDALDVFRPLAHAKRISLLHADAESLPLVVADRARIGQVFSNLIGNALDFTPDGGRIEIRATNLGGAVELSVNDDGAGIPVDLLPHVFDRYWQRNTAGRSGMGLGLAIARGIVQADGGMIRVESEVGRGSRFVFTLSTVMTETAATPPYIT